MEAAKPWSVSASLRGFYDDNYNAVNSDLKDAAGDDLKRDSFGFEISPKLSWNMPMEMSYLGLSYAYAARYYEDRPKNNWDQSHEVDLKADHRFSERYRISLQDSFVYAQEPEVVDQVSGFQTTYRPSADAYRNYADIGFNAQLTERVGLKLGYRNSWYDYGEDATDLQVPFNGFNFTDSQNGGGSRSSALDRMEHLFTLEGLYRLQPDLDLLAGYSFGVTDYTSKDPLASVTWGQYFLAQGLGMPIVTPVGSDRDRNTHYMYVGASRIFSRQWGASIRAGAQYADYVHLDDSEWNPYVDANVSYAYRPDSYVSGGIRYTFYPSDVSGFYDANGEFQGVKDSDAFLIYASVNHKITPYLTGSIIGRYQNSTFNGSDYYDGKADNFFVVGLNLSYEFSRYWSAEVGYNYDNLDSDLPLRGFDRNRIYLGVTAKY